MVTPALPTPDDHEAYEELQERWPAERASRRASKRVYRRKEKREVVIRAERLKAPDAARMSKALLAAQRHLAEAQAERDAREQERRHE